MKTNTLQDNMRQARGKCSAQDILRTLTGASSVVITGHIRTDGDSLGSMIALAHLLNRAGVRAVAAGKRHELGAPGFLRGAELLIPPRIAARRAHDLLVTVDCGSPDRLPEPFQKRLGNCPVVNIDHHVTNTRFGTFNWVDAKATAAGEMIWRLARTAAWPLDDIAAEALWVALVTDTGRFAYDSVKPSTLRCAADLLRHGVRTSAINDTLYASFSVTNMELKRRAFKTLTLIDNGKIAAVSLTGKDFEETDGVKADAEDVIDIPRNLAGNRVAFFFYGDEDDASETRVSIRTREPLNAAAFAMRFGGGGHPCAGGCTINKPLGVARKLVLKAAEDWIAEHGW